MELWNYINGLSYHPDDRTYNERNIGTGLGVRKTDYKDILELAAGQYKNSNNNDSRYLDASYHKKLNSILSLGAGAGVVTGYQDGNKLYVLPSIKFGNKDYELNLRYAPKYKKNPETLMLNFGYRL